MDGIQTGHDHRAEPTPWQELLHELERSLPRQLGVRDRWQIEWLVHGWARRHLGSAAIRVGGSEGLIGPAPARWRVLLHVEDDTGGCALAVLDGRAASTPENVVASLLIAPKADGYAGAIVSVSGHGTSLGEHPPTEAAETGEPTSSFVETPTISTMAEVLLGSRRAVIGSLASLPNSLRLASARALTEAGGALITNASSSKRRPRRPTTFVAAGEPGLASRLLRDAV